MKRCVALTAGVLLLKIQPGSGADPAPASSFLAEQRRYPRVRAAYQQKEAGLRALFAASGVDYPPVRLFIRAFKRERVLELWAGEPGSSPLSRVKTYDVCAVSGELGPKRRQGDGQIPEGFYRIDRFNPQSQFHLSLRVDYPNRADRLREGHRRLGGDIYIHGDCVTIGCLPIGDEGIKELYLLAVEARAAGGTIPVHVFPTRLDEAGRAHLAALAAGNAGRARFWRSLQDGYDAFEATRVVPVVEVDRAGEYVLRPSPAPRGRP
jgi:murein L,D-transpeptidase YafK